jgi:hypothetical protein
MEDKKEEGESSIAHELAEVVVVAGKVEKGACCCMRSCVKGWSLFLNACEAVLSGLSNMCLCCSACCLGCSKCLEQMDCDGK